MIVHVRKRLPKSVVNVGIECSIVYDLKVFRSPSANDHDDDESHDGRAAYPVVYVSLNYAPIGIN